MSMAEMEVAGETWGIPTRFGALGKSSSLCNAGFSSLQTEISVSSWWWWDFPWGDGCRAVSTVPDMWNSLHKDKLSPPFTSSPSIFMATPHAWQV